MRDTPDSRQLRDEFEMEVLAPIEAHHPETGDRLSYRDYLGLAPQLRSGDEQPFVTDVFTRRLLEWLGYRDADWTQRSSDERRRDRPDWTVSSKRTVSFVVETGDSTEEFGPQHIEKLRRYTAGTQGYALWTNGSVVLGLRFEPGRDGKILARMPVDTCQWSPRKNGDAGLAVLRLLFRRHRFVEMPNLLDRICVSEETWKERARPLDSRQAQRAFIEESWDVLDKLTLTVRAEIDQAETDLAEACADVERTRNRLEQEGERLLETLSQLPARHRQPVEDQLRELVSDPTDINEKQIEKLKPEEMGFHAGRDWDRRVDALLDTSADLRKQEVQRLRSRRIHNAFRRWRAYARSEEEEQEESTDSRDRNAYAKHVAYTLFLRLLVARALEDREVIDRVLSDGGLQRWRRFSEPTQIAAAQDPSALHGRALLKVLYRTVARFYPDVFSRPFFDWFVPDDYLLALTLEHLGNFSFADVTRDILELAPRPTSSRGES